MTSSLSGLEIVVVSLRDEAAAVTAALRSAGAAVTELPVEEAAAPGDLRALERAATELALFDWLVLRSGRMAEATLSRAGGALPSRLRVAVQGNRARLALGPYEIEPALVVEDDNPDTLVAALAPFLGRCQRVLVPHEEGAEMSDLLRGLEAAGAEAVPVVARGASDPIAGAALERTLGPAARRRVLFPSAGCVRPFVRLCGDGWEPRRGLQRAVAMDTETAQALAGAGALDVVQIDGGTATWLGDLAAVVGSGAGRAPRS